MHLEVELWRRSHSITSRHSEVDFSANVVDSLAAELMLQPSISTSSYDPSISPSHPTLPSNPAAFNLTTPHRRRSSPGSCGTPTFAAPRHQDCLPEPASRRDLDQIRLKALTELQKSVVENGEGFVSKMRDWETHREREAAARRGLKRSRSTMAHRSPDPTDESDDVMILDSTPEEEAYLRESPRKKRAPPVNTADVLDFILPETTPSTLTDDDTKSCSPGSISAALSSDTPPYPNTPSYPDKAVSALTQALANGACGINDYQAVLDAYNHTHHGEESHAGELWD